jgi:hypothetical protein
LAVTRSIIPTEPEVSVFRSPFIGGFPIGEFFQLYQ